MEVRNDAKESRVKKELIVVVSGYQGLAMRTAMLLDTPFALLHGAVGITGEFFEATDAYGKANFEEELGDICWFIAYTLNVLDVNLELMLGALMVEPDHRIRSLEVVCWETMHPIHQHCSDLLDITKGLAFYKKPLDEEKRRKLTYICGQLWMSVVYMARGRMQQILEHNVLEKLAKRYPDRYTDAHAVLRLDKVEG